MTVPFRAAVASPVSRRSAPSYDEKPSIQGDCHIMFERMVWASSRLHLGGSCFPSGTGFLLPGIKCLGADRPTNRWRKCGSGGIFMPP